MFGKKRLARKMIGGVNVVKLVLYKILRDDFSKRYQKEGEEFYKTLAGATVNEVFGSHSEASRVTFDENKETVVQEIETLGIRHSELRRPISDAIRVYIQASFILSGELPRNYSAIFNNAIDRGVFIGSGGQPIPKTFLAMTEELSKKYL